MHAVPSLAGAAMHSVFPPEILDLIIEAGRDDKEFLRAWSLVTKQRRATALRCHFQEIRLKTYPSSLPLAIAQWHDRHGDSVLFVRRVIVQGTFAAHHIILNGLSHTDVSAILCAFPKCDAVALVDTAWIPSHTPKTMIPRCQQLVELECRDVEFFPTLNPEVMPGIWPSLRRMSVIYQGLNTLFSPVPAVESPPAVGSVSDVVFAYLENGNAPRARRLLATVTLSIEVFHLFLDKYAEADDVSHALACLHKCHILQSFCLALQPQWRVPTEINLHTVTEALCAIPPSCAHVMILVDARHTAAREHSHAEDVFLERLDWHAINTHIACKQGMRKLTLRFATMALTVSETQLARWRHESLDKLPAFRMRGGEIQIDFVVADQQLDLVHIPAIISSR